MRIVDVGDTHGKHDELGILEGDVLIHCGDFCDGFRKSPSDVDGIDAWFARQQFECILCIGGNHDFAAAERLRLGLPVFRNAVWLQDTSHVYRGVTFYGAPWLPHLQGWAFYMTPGELQEKWSMIPDGTDVLITHTPPFGILDRPRSGNVSCGCPDLLKQLEVVRPRYHVFGHIHASAGIYEGEHTTFVNAASVDSSFDIARVPVTLEYV
jgi:predicted phosphodiesterase